MQRVRVYRSTRKDGMYLFVDAERDLDEVPEALLRQFGRPVEAMELDLTPDRRLARASAPEVIERIRTVGYYLQMPPSERRPPGKMETK